MEETSVQSKNIFPDIEVCGMANNEPFIPEKPYFRFSGLKLK